MILHLDLDAFFVSAERTRNPALIGKPVAVGGRGDPFIFDTKPAKQKRLVQLNDGAFVPTLFAAEAAGSDMAYFREEGRLRGIVTTASYEARAFGVKTAMTVFEAVRLCPQIILVRPDFLLYHTLSHRLHALLESEVPLVEQYSIDEFFLDARGWIADADLPCFMQTLKQRVQEELGLPVSIGAAPSKWLAKLATGMAKPAGVRLLRADELPGAIANVPVDDFPGVGRAFSKRLQRYRIRTVGQALEARNLFEGWGRHGCDLYARLEGSDREAVRPARGRKSVGISRSMDHPVRSRTELFRRIRVMVRHLSHTLLRLGVHPTVYSFHLGYGVPAEAVRSAERQRANKQVTRCRLFNEPFLQELARSVFAELDRHPELPVQYLGISGGKFLHTDPKTPDLLHFEADMKARQLDAQITKMRDKYGMDILRGGAELLNVEC